MYAFLHSEESVLYLQVLSEFMSALSIFVVQLGVKLHVRGQYKLLLSEFVYVDRGKNVFVFLACMKLHDVNDLCLIYKTCKNTIFRIHFYSLRSQRHIASDCIPYLICSHKNNKLKNY